jgi:2-polyprenyl-6-methoxyphenol hydroxylase-like FAD-dependent oxidoreductase
MSVPAAKLKRFGGDAPLLFEQILKENAGLHARMRRARLAGEWLASPLPRFAVRDHWPERIIPLGNAAAALEPIGGEGMGLAMRSAEIVAEELIAAERAGREYDPIKLRRAMRGLWSARSAACRIGALMLSRPKSAKWVTRFGTPFAPAAMKLVGK